MSQPDLQSSRAEAERLLASGDAQGAYQAFRAVLAYPCRLDSSIAWGSALATFAQISKGVGAEKLADLCAAAAKAPESVDALWDAAFELYEETQYAIAASLLARANELAPGRPKLLNELVCNLEAIMLNHEAVRVLRAAPEVVESDRLARYLLGYNALMSGDLETPRPIVPTLEGTGDRNFDFMASALEGMLARADALLASRKLDSEDLRGWHLVLNGSVLLHRSPFGLDQPMRGRYAYVSDSYSLIRQGIERVGAVLSAVARAPASVAAAPGRSHEATATAAARILEVPLLSWNERSSKPPCLLVAYDLDALDAEAMKSLKVHQPGQVLWAHASCWTNPFPFAPDLTTLLYQTNVAPWGAGRMRVDPQTRATSRTEEDTASVEELAQRVVDAGPVQDALDDVDDLLALVRASAAVAAPHRLGILCDEGQRLRQRVGSPVPSARFL
jgi:hypothetical protein